MKNNILEDKDLIIYQQYELQQLHIAISTEYINADLTDIDGLISKSLKQMGQFVEADRSYIFSYDFNNNNCSNTHEWCNDGIQPEIENLQEVPIEHIPHWLESHKNGEAFYVQNVSLLPDEGEFGLKAILEPQGIQSLIAIPMIKEGELIGFVGFDSVKKLFNYSENEKNILFVFANMLVNVQQRKENEERIRAQEVKKELLLKSLEKQNQELSDYAHAVSHDLKAPLRNIDTLINRFIEDNSDKLDDGARESLQVILSNLEKMDNLIKGILEYSSINRVERILSWVDIKDIVKDSLSSILIPANFKIEIAENLPKIYTNNHMIKQVFQNIIQNAVTYSRTDEPTITVKYNETNEGHLFSIEDNGIGIEKMHHDKIFKTFTKLNENSQSSGLGLSIVKRIIESMNGKIWFESEINKGTTFYFILPIIS